MKKLLGLLLLVSLLTLSVFSFGNQPKAQASNDSNKYSSGPMDFGPNGWAGWSCPAGTQVVGGGYEPEEASTLNSLAWKPGASVDGYNYPTTPFGYTYAEGEVGWIVQNNNDGKSISVFALCDPILTPTPTQTPNVGGPGDGRSDGLGCGSNDCSGNKVGGSSNQAVLGASTGPQVLGLSTTSGNENSALIFAQLFAAFIFSVVGFKFLKKNA